MTPERPEEQLHLFPDGIRTVPQSLDALIQTAHVEAARSQDGGAVGAVVRRLAEGDGSALVASLRAEGFPDEAIAAAVTTDAADRRRKPRARLGVVGGSVMVWLTTTGWQSAGRTSARERHPSSESQLHAAAPSQLAEWLDAKLARWPHLRITVVTGAPTRTWGEELKSLAWGRLQGAGDTTGRFGVLTGGLIPDALLVTRWRTADDYRAAWGQDPAAPEDAAEETSALETELTRKALGPLRAKVTRWEAALDLGAAHRVIWLVRSHEVAENLLRLGVGTERSRQLLVPAAAVGMEGDPMPDVVPTWWPLRVAGADA